MTKRREPLTYHHALTVIAARIGWDRCGTICGVTDRAVRNWSDPDAETEIRLIDAERLDRAFLADGGDHAPFQRLLTLRLEIATCEHVSADLVRTASKAAKESGEAVSALLEAAQNPRDPEALRAARREGEEALGAISNGLAAIDRLGAEAPHLREGPEHREGRG